eukprot:COSAG02_NODE_43427_length_375_cov_0.554348_2_plen_92_part_01
MVLPSVIRRICVCVRGTKLRRRGAVGPQIFDHDMFKSQMAETFKLDTSKLPLGKLSKAQLDKGMNVLSDLEKALQRKNRTTITELSSRFYTV